MNRIVIVTYSKGTMTEADIELAKKDAAEHGIRMVFIPFKITSKLQSSPRVEYQN